MASDKNPAQDVLLLLKLRGVLASSEIRTALSLSQSTVSRALSTIPGLITLGIGKNRKYALMRGERDFPITKVDESGSLIPLGTLKPIAPRGAVFICANETETFTSKTQVYEDIPYFIWDIRPQGFLGKLFVNRNPELQLPDHWQDWSEKDLYRTLDTRGEDLVGNLLIGNQSFKRFQQQEVRAINITERNAHYSELVEQTLTGFFAGSSAGGEQPKFTATLKTPSEWRHVIVKFSPPTDTNHGKRWADLLRAEHMALESLNKFGVPAAKTELMEHDGRVFLEVSRFDRTGKRGRKGVLSLSAIDNQFIGSHQNWTQSANILKDQKKLSPKDCRTIALLDAFGGLIANTDRHFGNLSLYWEMESQRLQPTPAYDMLPMLYAPIQGNVTNPKFQVPNMRIEQMSVWADAKSLAIEFWKIIANDIQFSEEFRRIANQNASLIENQPQTHELRDK